MPDKVFCLDLPGQPRSDPRYGLLEDSSIEIGIVIGLATRISGCLHYPHFLCHCKADVKVSPSWRQVL